MDLLIVGSSTDSLAIALAELCAQSGYSAEIMDVPTAARLYSLSVEKGEALVEPDVPIFLRMGPPKDIRNSFDEAFLYGECFAMFCAAAALSKSMVINRPYKGSFGGKVTQSTTLTELRLRLSHISTEVFANIMPVPPIRQPNRVWCVQDLVTYDTTEWPMVPSGMGPYRAKWSDFEPAYEMVTVLGQEAWRLTAVKLENLMLEAKSIELLSQLELIFGVVTWAISPSLENAVLVRVDPYPSLNQVQIVWPELSRALLKVFFNDTRSWT